MKLAQLTLEQVIPRGDGTSTRRRVVLVLTGLWVVLVVANAVYAAVFRGLGEISWFHLVAVAVLVGSPLWQSRKLRQTVALDSGPGGPSGEPGD